MHHAAGSAISKQQRGRSPERSQCSRAGAPATALTSSSTAAHTFGSAHTAADSGQP